MALACTLDLAEKATEGALRQPSSASQQNRDGAPSCREEGENNAFSRGCETADQRAPYALIAEWIKVPREEAGGSGASDTRSVTAGKGPGAPAGDKAGTRRGWSPERAALRGLGAAGAGPPWGWLRGAGPGRAEPGCPGLGWAELPRRARPRAPSPGGGRPARPGKRPGERRWERCPGLTFPSPRRSAPQNGFAGEAGQAAFGARLPRAVPGLVSVYSLAFNS